MTTQASHVPGLSADNDTVTAVAGAAEKDAQLVVVTSESLTTAAAADYTLTLTNARIKAGSVVLASIQNGSNSAGTPVLRTVTPADGSVVIKVYNAHAANAFDGTIKVSVAVL